LIAPLRIGTGKASAAWYHLGMGRIHALTLASAGVLTACGHARPAMSAAPSGSPQTQSTAATDSLLGTTPPEWEAERWMNSQPLHLGEIRGKVVLVRWWTDGCPFCSATAPALRRFDHDYAAQGLVVVGMYHHKCDPSGPCSADQPMDPHVYEDTAKSYGFTFPVAFDPDWRTLKSWLRGVDTGFTSVTFVLDRKGVVRHVHPGGQYVEGDAAYAKLRSEIEALLREG
jgi:thiol-disulfide isomerase/thioredoxin